MIVQAGVGCKYTNDTQRFLVEHFDIIKNSPSHIYHSALPLSPPSSWLQKCYNADISAVRVVKGLSAKWGACSHTVLLNDHILALSYYNNMVAVGSISGNIIILNAITGNQMAVFSAHTEGVNSLTFSLDGSSLVSGSDDCTIKLWDVQTGGVVKTFSGHTGYIWSVSISQDLTIIASGSSDGTICMWDTQTAECHCIIEQQGGAMYVSFSLIDPQHLISICDGKVWQWDTYGHQTKPPYDGSCIAFSSDGVQFVFCDKAAVTVQNSNSEVVVARFHVASSNTNSCCFSPDNRLVAVAADSTVYVWDITSSDPHLVETLIDHTRTIHSLSFSSPSSLISASQDQSIKFWQIGILSMDPTVIDQTPTPLDSAPIVSITLQPRDGIAISSDSYGVVRTWDLSTGLCKASLPTPVKGQRDIRLVNDRLIVVWHRARRSHFWNAEGERVTDIMGRIHIWDAEQGGLLQMVDTPESRVRDLWITEDGSKVFCLGEESIQAWSIWTGEVVGEVRFQGQLKPDSLAINGSKVWVHFPGLPTQGWDFGIPDSSPVPLSNVTPNKPYLDITSGTEEQSVSLPTIKCAATGSEVLQLPQRYANPSAIQCSHQYLVAGYQSGEVVILDFNHLLSS